MEKPKKSDAISMTKKALAARLESHANAVLRDLWGTDNRYRIEIDRDELAARRDADRSWRRAAKAEKRLQEMTDSQTFAAYDRDATAILKKHVAPKFVNMVLRELKDHVLTLDERETRKPKLVFESFAKAFVQKNPELARRAPKAKAKRSTPKRAA